MGHSFRLRPSQRANRIDQFPPGLDSLGRARKQLELHSRQLRHIFRSRRPSRMRISLPSAKSTARSIDQHAVKFRLRRQFYPAVPEDASIIKTLGATCSQLQLFQPPFRSITRPDEPLVSHQIGKVERLAAFTGAYIPPGLTRLGITEQPDCLRCDVLQFEFTGLKFRRPKQILDPAILDRVRKRRSWRNPTISELFRQRSPLPVLRPQPQSWVMLQCAQPVI